MCASVCLCSGLKEKKSAKLTINGEGYQVNKTKIQACVIELGEADGHSSQISPDLTIFGTRVIVPMAMITAQKLADCDD